MANGTGPGPREALLGVVDIGSNTVHLLVARTNGRSLVPTVDISEGLRLGGDIDTDGAISSGKLQELVDTLTLYEQAAKEAGVGRLRLLATQALRVASNRDQVIKAIEDATGLCVEILGPDQEAALAYLGADASCPSVGPQVMLDIGGGSAQIAIGQYGQVWGSISLPLGAARMAAHFLPTDPPTHVEEALLTSYFAKVVLPSLPLPDTTVTGIVGVGGTLRPDRTPSEPEDRPAVPAAGPRTPSQQAAGQVRGDDCLHVQHPARACSAISACRVASQGSVARIR